MYKPTKMILTAGPAISQKEVSYVTDAVKNGWNFHFNDYVEKFEAAFAKYLGVKHARVTSCGTGAMHLALLAMGVTKGDEVIVPEISAVASANVVTFVGAKPVFADVERDTWCIDPASIEKLITKKTKAIMPVHLYGHPANMKEINRIAKKHGLYVLEDACPAIGATINGKKVGGIGDMGAFSFQGAKTIVTGEGGMLVSNNTKLFEKAIYFLDLGRDRSRGAFWHTLIGYKYNMNNISAALGLAQLEKVEDLLKRKRKIFEWYYKRLGKVEGLSMNVEKKWARNGYWMSSIVLDKDFGISRDELMEQLKKNKIDTRPFFNPFSLLPMYKSKSKNIHAYHAGLNGINLPSGVNLKEEEVDYVAQTVRKLLKV